MGRGFESLQAYQFLTYFLALTTRFRRRRQRLQFLRAGSRLLWMPKCVATVFGGQEMDFLFIDGDHHYEGVSQDFDTYALMVRKGGLIATHDIAEGKPEVLGGMPQLWDEVKSQYWYSEIIDDTFQAVSGIGLLYVDYRHPQAMVKLKAPTISVAMDTCSEVCPVALLRQQFALVPTF